MLTPLPLQARTAGSTGSTEKLIHIYIGSVNVVIYTVPAGRVFTGFVSGTSSSGPYINDQTLVLLSANSGIEIKLTEGTVVKSAPGGQTYIFGYEKDA